MTLITHHTEETSKSFPEELETLIDEDPCQAQFE